MHATDLSVIEQVATDQFESLGHDKDCVCCHPAGLMQGDGGPGLRQLGPCEIGHSELQGGRQSGQDP